MSIFCKIIYFSLGAAVLSVAINYWETYEEHSYRQRLTVVVEVDRKSYSGSSVTSVTAVIKPFEEWLLPDNSGFRRGGSGEAAVVSLPNGKYLFALLRGGSEAKSSGSFDEMALWTFPEERNPRDVMQAYRFFASAPAGTKADVPRKAYPLLVTFGDINDPASVKRVDPDNLADTFGGGYSLKSITLELTDAPRTDGSLKKHLVWLDSHKGRIKPTAKKFLKDLTVEETLYPNDFGTVSTMSGK